ncbi:MULTISPECIES: YpmS family protein [Sporosarcina]|uniref:YpmS family protein n=1 Tax=Sporosarcina contaminans TaxID=633403 RepID=A0ABW3U1N8_9BACL
MNFWKWAFFTLAGLIVAGVVAFIIFLETPGTSEPLPELHTFRATDHVLTVKATKEDFEGIANHFIRKAMKGEPLPVTMSVKDDVILQSELTVFNITLPVVMHFDPEVREDGNLILNLSSLEIGAYNMQPSAVLKILRDSFKLPEWMVIRPKEEEIFLSLTDLPVSGDLVVRAKSFNLAEDDIELEIVIPTE